MTRKKTHKTQMDQKILIKRAIRMKKGLRRMLKRAKMMKKEMEILRRRKKIKLAKMGQVQINKEQNMRFQLNLIRISPKSRAWKTLRV